MLPLTHDPKKAEHESLPRGPENPSEHTELAGQAASGHDVPILPHLREVRQTTDTSQSAQLGGGDLLQSRALQHARSLQHVLHAIRRLGEVQLGSFEASCLGEVQVFNFGFKINFRPLRKMQNFGNIRFFGLWTHVSEKKK